MQEFEEFFPDPRHWDEDLVAVGGDFSPDRMFYAYTHGIFPWSEDPIRWFCLEPRAIFDLERVHFSRTVKRKVRKELYTISINQCFTEVMKSCSHRPMESTWITEGFLKGYTHFHDLGYAHSVEAWNQNGELVGGVYGVAIGKFFAGESMFSFESDAGKICLYHLFEELKAHGFQLFDTQQLNHVTWDLGAYEIPKDVYLDRLAEAVKDPKPWVISPRFLKIHPTQSSTSP
ncbi:MAG: leucyl/phenylalanyl-tRNA--protein transferase [Leptospira sp.]|nr:leucyl/phenylalanyl-tRNA--protein transferase [Leptospira sp.]